MHTNWQLEMTRRMFLITKRKRASISFNVSTIVEQIARFNKRQTCDTNLFCHCSMPEYWDDMVQCELCEERLHMSCEGFKTAPEGEWLCIVCRLPDSRRLRNC